MDILSVMDYHERSYLTLCKSVPLLSLRFKNLAIPLHPSFSYDLLAEDRQGQIHKIKTIHTSSKAPSGSYVATLRKNSYKKSEKHKFSESADILFIETPENSYLIPTKKIENTRSISLSLFDKYKLIPD